MNAAFSSSVAAELHDDETRFVGQLRTVTAIQHVVIPLTADPLVKRMSTLRRRDDTCPDTFKSEWFVHSFLVRRLQEVKGYTQNLVIDRIARGDVISCDKLAADGIVEMWFDDLSSLTAGFKSNAGKTLMSHATEFISEISNFLVDVEPVV